MKFKRETNSKNSKKPGTSLYSWYTRPGIKHQVTGNNFGLLVKSYFGTLLSALWASSNFLPRALDVVGPIAIV